MSNHGAPLQPLTFNPPPDIRLVAADMDGTLLDDEHELHEHFWPLAHELHRRGILFCPASGRQYFNLLERFADIADEVVFIAENGTFVVYQGQEISSDCLELIDVHRLVATMRESIVSGVDAGIVVCGKRSAYIDRSDRHFADEVERYFARLQVVGDLLAVLQATASPRPVPHGRCRAQGPPNGSPSTTRSRLRPGRGRPGWRPGHGDRRGQRLPGRPLTAHATILGDLRGHVCPLGDSGADVPVEEQHPNSSATR